MADIYSQQYTCGDGAHTRVHMQADRQPNEQKSEDKGSSLVFDPSRLSDLLYKACGPGAATKSAARGRITEGSPPSTISLLFCILANLLRLTPCDTSHLDQHIKLLGIQ
jgi:hypothetical protein